VIALFLAFLGAIFLSGLETNPISFVSEVASGIHKTSRLDHEVARLSDSAANAIQNVELANDRLEKLKVQCLALNLIGAIVEAPGDRRGHRAGTGLRLARLDVVEPNFGRLRHPSPRALARGTRRLPHSGLTRLAKLRPSHRVPHLVRTTFASRIERLPSASRRGVLDLPRPGSTGPMMPLEALVLLLATCVLAAGIVEVAQRADLFHAELLRTSYGRFESCRRPTNSPGLNL